MVACAMAPAGMLRIKGMLTIPGEQRLSDYCNRAEGPIELAPAAAVLVTAAGEQPRWKGESILVNPATIDLLWTSERRRAGDPSLRLPVESRPVRVQTRGAEVVGAVSAPSMSPGLSHLFGGSNRFITLSPAQFGSDSMPVCLVNRALLVAIAGEPLAAVPGRAPACTRARCERPVAGSCAYADATGTVCGTSWCDDHSRVLGENRYCQRHHDVVAALTAARGTLGEFRPPLVTDRTMSLTQFIFRELDADLQAVLEPIRQQVDGAVLSVDQNVRPQLIDGELLWERGWGVAVPQGYVTRIVLRVPLGEPPVLRVIVNRAEIFSGVPDWIAARQHGAAPTPADQQAFTRALVQLISGRLSYS